MKLLTIAIALFLSACGSKQGATSPKDPFSVWTADGSTVSLDLSHGPGTASGTISQAAAVICTCTFAIAGAHLNGTLDISACSGAGSCSTYEGAFTYAYALDETLEICRTSDSTCTQYH